MNRRGFTLPELLIFVAIFAGVVIGLATTLITLTGVQSHQTSANEVETQGQFLMQQIQYYVQSARLVDMPPDVPSSAMATFSGTGSNPAEIAFDGTDMWVTNLYDDSVTQISPTGVMTPHPGTGKSPVGIAFDGVNMWTANQIGNSVTKFSPNGDATPISDVGNQPTGIASDGTNMWTANFGDSSVTEITPSGVMHKYPVTGNNPGAIAYGGGYMWTTNYNSDSVTRISSSGVTTPFPGTGKNPAGIASDGTNMWTANFGDNSVTKVSPTGDMTPFPGTGRNPTWIAFDGTNMWTSNSGDNSVTKVSPTGVMTKYTDAGDFPAGIAFDGTNMWVTNKNSNSVTRISPIEGTLKLRETSAAQDPMLITVSSGTVYLTQGTGGTPQPLTSNKVVVSNLAFTRHYAATLSSAYGSDSISYSFTVSVNTQNPTQQYSQTFQGTASVSAPAPQVALLQQAKAESASAASLSVSYPNANATGSLLVAVVSNTGTSSAVFGISDTAGNNWVKAANPKYPAYDQEVTVFYAANAVGTSTSVTVSSTVAVTNLSLFAYEYRGAEASGPLDIRASRLQPNTASPSTGLTTPLADAELVMGILYSYPSGVEIPNPGPGFTLITTSSLSATYVEDRNTYVTGPLDASWQYPTQSPSSSAVIITFRRGLTSPSQFPGFWTYVPSNLTLGTAQFQVMKYEAKCIQAANRTALTSPTNVYHTYDNTSQPCTGSDYFVGSTPYGYPITNIDQATAASYCVAIGAHLITNTEWQAIIRNSEPLPSNWKNGTVGSQEASGGGLYRGNSSSSAAMDGADPLSGTNTRTLSLAGAGIVWDIAGNVWEWTNDTILGSNQPHTGSGGWTWREFNDITDWGAMTQPTAGPYDSSWDHTHGVGRIYSDGEAGETNVHSFIRGGAWDSGTYAGASTLNLLAIPSDKDVSVGFRCAK